MTGNGENAVSTFDRIPATGALTYIESEFDGVDGGNDLSTPWGVAVAGNFLYVASNGDDAVTTFSRAPGTGILNFVEVDKDGVSGVDGLDVATGVAVSPDGGQVYVTGCQDNAVATFTRDAGTGALTWTGQQKDGVSGVDGLACARGVAVSPDGENVAVAGESDDSVSTFTRASSNGALTFLEFEDDGVAGADGLDGARDVAFSLDGGSLYVASLNDDAVASFSRNTSSGSLSFLEMDKDGVGGVDGLNGANGVAASLGGTNVYASAESDNAVASFTREPTVVEPDPPPSGDPAARTISFNASKKKVKKGKPVRLSGTVASPTAATACAASQSVKIERKLKGKSAFSPLATVTSNGSGAFTSSQKVKKTAQYRAVVDAGTACVAATSTAKNVKVKKKKKKKKKGKKGK